MKIQEFDIDIRHVKEKKSIAADTMSRNVISALGEPIKSIMKKRDK
jgi:hypothetical protein